MSVIVLSDEQTKTLRDARGVVQIRDQRGNSLGYITHGFTEEDLAEARRRIASSEPRFSTEEVLAHIQSLASK